MPWFQRKKTKTGFVALQNEPERAKTTTAALQCQQDTVQNTLAPVTGFPAEPPPAVARRPTATVFPFDGSCEKSKDADLTLTFATGPVLKAHAAHLAEASPVLKTALGGIKPVDTLYLGEDSREAWILLLNLLHPGRRLSSPRPVDFASAKQTEDIVGVAQKYSVAVLYDYADAGLSMILENMKAAVPRAVSSSFVRVVLSRGYCLFHFLKLSASFELHATREACLRYLKRCLRAAWNANRDVVISPNKQYGSAMAGFVRALAQDGHDDIAAWIAQETFSYFSM